MTTLVLAAGGPDVVEVSPAERAEGAETSILSVRVPDAGQGYVVGGALLGRGDPDVALLDELPLMPSYARERHPVLAGERGPLRCSQYVKLPVFAAETTRGAIAVSFPVRVEDGGAGVPTWFGLARVGGELRFDVVVPHEWDVLRKPAADWDAWREGEMHAQRRSAGAGPWRAGPVRVFEGPDLASVLRAAAATLVPQPPAADAARHGRRALGYLASVQDPRHGAFLEWHRREGGGFLNGWYSLPTFHALAGLLSELAERVPLAAAMSDRAAGFLLLPGAAERDRDHAVFHNTASLTRLGRPRFFTHLGTGAAGYPGGQAHAIEALARRLLASRGGDAERSLLAAAVCWLLSRRGSDGRLPRAERIFDEPDATALGLGPDTRSDGGDGQAARALLLAAKAMGTTTGTGTGTAAWNSAAVALLECVEAAWTARGYVCGFLRDARQSEPESISHVSLVRAHLAAAEVTGDAGHVRAAAAHGSHLAAWIRPGRKEAASGLDSLAASFGPRLAPYESLCAAVALHELEQRTGEAVFGLCARACADVLRTEEGHAGYGEASYLDEGARLHPLGFECAYTAAAVLEWAACSTPEISDPGAFPQRYRAAPRSPVTRLLRRFGRVPR